jgi:hypothetical protein
VARRGIGPAIETPEGPDVGDITDSVAAFREAARHLWNTFFYPKADWDDRDRFSQVCVDLFAALVVAPAGLSDTRLPNCTNFTRRRFHLFTWFRGRASTS